MIQIQNDIKELLPEQIFCVCVQCEHDIGDMTLNKSHDTPVDHG